MPPARCTSSMWYFCVFGATLHNCGTRRLSASMSRIANGTSGLSIGHASPEAAAGGTIGLVRDGDRIRIDIPQRAISLLVAEDELAARRAEQDAKGWKPAQPRARRVSTALKAYALLATSADKGAVRDRQLLDGV